MIGLNIGDAARYPKGNLIALDLVLKITAQQLEEFASKSLAKGLLPELMRRLIRATSDRIDDVHFPAGESTFRPGVDGLLRAAGKPPYVPEGVSIWELSTEKSPHVKGRKDVEKRNLATAPDKYLDKPRLEITYVAVSLRRWHGEDGVDRDAFEREWRDKGIWKDVKVIDADHLAEWLENSPSVSAWLARKMHIASEDTKSIEAFWEDYRTGITPAMSPELLLLSREQKAEELIAAVVRGDFSRVKADSPNEAAAFVAAAILSLPEEDPRRNALLAKGVIITRPESDIYLTDTDQKLFVITLGRATDAAGRLDARGHTLVAAYGNSHTARGTNSTLIDLRRPKREEFVAELVKMGMKEKEARETASDCHCSITVLYRIRDLAHSRRPDWASVQQLGKLLGPMLSGAYLHSRPADTAVVAALAGVGPEQVEQNVLEVLKVDDAPVRREGELTALSAPPDIWQLGLEQGVITKDVLDRFRAAALQVLGERDPSLDLPIEQRAFASMEGRTLVHSSSLRRGVTEVLRLIAINEEALGEAINGFSAQQFVDGVLRDLPGLAVDYQTLASLDSLLPDMAEAAPLPFLSALETLSAGDGSKLSPIFEGSDDAMFGRTYYLGTLRALEVLAWDPTYLVRATQILARLAELDPGGQLSNRPINSLGQIFLPWRPHTNTLQPARHQALTKLCDKFPDLAWTLLSKLLPVHHGVSFGTAEPQWREMGASQRPTPTHGSAGQDWQFVITTAIPLASAHPDRWIDLLDAAATLQNEKLLDALLAAIQGDLQALVAAGHEEVMWEKLSALAAKHRAFESAQWAMPDSMITKIEHGAAKFEPNDPVALARHLFSHSLIQRLNPKETFEEREVRSNAERDAAVVEVWKQGAEALLTLIRQAPTPGLVAPSISRVGSEDQVREFVLNAFDKGEPIARVSELVAAHGASKFGADWGAQTIHELEAAGASPEQIAATLSFWDDTPNLLALISAKSAAVQDAYWRARDSFVRSGDDALVAEAVAKMIDHGRSVDLISFVGSSLGKNDTATLMQIVAQAFDEVVAEPERIKRVDTYWLREIFAGLRKRSDADRDTLMSLEYRWFPALHSYGEPQTFALHEYMGEKPEFFVEVLSDLYRAQADDEAPGEDEAQEEASEAEADQAKGKAEIAFKLLESWQSLPWIKSDGSLDGQAMTEWVKEAWRLAEAAGRLRVAEREVGKLLAYSPNDPDDGLWPRREVRELIEEVANPEMEDAIVMELFNKRGVHTRPFEGGGDPERTLAQNATELAQKLQDTWPRTAEVLRESARDWLHHAKREDQRAAEKRISL